jgi:RimJ/RimL family protein N-acetyltransferase
MNVNPVTLVGVRSRLVPLTMAHLDALWEAGDDPAIWTYFPFRPQTRGQMAEYLQKLLDDQRDGTSLPFTIIDTDTARVVGSTRLHNISVANRSAEIGTTWLSPEVWRTRMNTESKFLLLRHCFETWGMVRVQLKTDVRNERSQRAIERLGAVREGMLRRHWIMLDGHVRDSVLYSITDEDWPAIRDRLEERLR